MKALIIDLAAQDTFDPQNWLRSPPAEGATRTTFGDLGGGLVRSLRRVRARVNGQELIAGPTQVALPAGKDCYHFVRPGAVPQQVVVSVDPGAPAPQGQAGDFLVDWCRTDQNGVVQQSAVAARMRLLVISPAEQPGESEADARLRGEAFLGQQGDEFGADDYAVHVEP